jgi:hypothetical protein
MLSSQSAAAALALGAFLLASCAAPSAADLARVAADRHAEGLALQRWATEYDPSGGLFEAAVGIDQDNTTFTFTATGAWDALSDDEQHAAVANAQNAVKDAWCYQADHRKNLIPGLIVQIVDDSGATLAGTVTGAGLVCT